MRRASVTGQPKFSGLNNHCDFAARAFRMLEPEQLKREDCAYA
jgi:hypothetical protein